MSKTATTITMLVGLLLTVVAGVSVALAYEVLTDDEAAVLVGRCTKWGQEPGDLCAADPGVGCWFQGEGEWKDVGWWMGRHILCEGELDQGWDYCKECTDHECWAWRTCTNPTCYTCYPWNNVGTWLYTRLWNEEQSEPDCLYD